ncbi:MAG: hypothetical protein Q7S90_02465 [Rubrivivax sp.]|nr:hypothetical protein [Rubrivivax sp.]
MNKLVALAWLVFTSGTLLTAQAQAVWRCGPDGRTFSDRPCADGQPLQRAELADTRSAAQVQAAQEVVARERRLAENLRQERLERERLAMPPSHKFAAAHRPPASHRTEGVKPKQGANKPQAKRPRPADDGIWRAVAPSSRGTKD